MWPLQMQCSWMQIQCSLMQKLCSGQQFESAYVLNSAKLDSVPDMLAHHYQIYPVGGTLCLLLDQDTVVNTVDTTCCPQGTPFSRASLGPNYCRFWKGWKERIMVQSALFELHGAYKWFLSGFKGKQVLKPSQLLALLSRVVGPPEMN